MLALMLTISSCQGQVSVKYELPAKLKDRPERILQRVGYTTSYNEQTKTPNWVAWHLTKAHTYGKNQRKQEVFTEDEDIAKSLRATNMDYYNSRYDRGHMCPAGDNKWDKEAMRQSFLFTNICPQNHGLNKYEWNDLEILCRDWARKYGAIDIVGNLLVDIRFDMLNSFSEGLAFARVGNMQGFINTSGAFCIQKPIPKPSLMDILSGRKSHLRW